MNQIDQINQQIIEKRMENIGNLGKCREFETIYIDGKMHAHVGLLEISGYFRVAKMAVYLNRAGQPQITLWVSDWAILEEAEKFWLEAAANSFALEWDAEYRISNGSGLRQVA